MLRWQAKFHTLCSRLLTGMRAAVFGLGDFDDRVARYARRLLSRKTSLPSRAAASAGGILVMVLIWMLLPSSTVAPPSSVKVALHVSLSGAGAYSGRALRDAVQFAVDELNEDHAAPRLELAIYDDGSTVDGAKETARRIAADQVAGVVGPSLTTTALAAAPEYEKLGLPHVVATAHGDDITRSTMTFRTVISNGDIGETLANYISYVLGGTRAIVIYKDDGYGRPIAARFREAAGRLGLQAQFVPLNDPNASKDAAKLVEAATTPDRAPIVLGMNYGEAVPALKIIRREGYRGLILGTATMARASFVDLFSNEPEVKKDPGFFTDGIYAVSPIMLDSANAETLAFAQRYRARYGNEASWETVQGFDAIRLIKAALASSYSRDANSLVARRLAVRDYFISLKDIEHSAPSMTGPVWFGADRGRKQPPRIGRYRGSLFESAPVQLFPVSSANKVEIDSGGVVQIAPDRFARRQQVVYTGVFLNEIPRVDVAQSTFTADFYLWTRFAKSVPGVSADPTELDFPDLVRGSFDAKHPAESGDLDDGTSYRLWRMRGDFKNDFDLHHYPLDKQKLSLRFFNGRAASDRIVYVQDLWSSQGFEKRDRPAVDATVHATAGAANANTRTPAAPDVEPTENAAPAAFRNLTQWQALGAAQRRDILVTASALGDPRLATSERVRELSGFNLTVDLKRRILATLAKTLLPLALMTLILYAALNFPHGLVKEKVTVTITAALSGTVLLSSINSQLGNVGYILAVEYIFYIFFALCLLCIVSVLAAERLRVAGHKHIAERTEQTTKAVFVLTATCTIGVAWIVSSAW